MADLETTFGSLQSEERWKRLERTLKLASLKKDHSQNVHSEKYHTSWPSISSIDVDSLNTGCSSTQQVSSVKSEVLASSNNLRNTLLKRKIYDDKKKMMSTSSVKEYNVKQDDQIDRFIMPPPKDNTIYCTTKKGSQQRICVSSNHEQNSSCSSANVNINKEYFSPFVTPMPPASDPQRVNNRVFSRWRVILNNQHELIIKGTLECGTVARSKPIVRRYTATCIESKFKHKYSLQGHIVDERYELPDYIRGKFYNGFPDDWENVYQIWRTYVIQDCPVIFHWPTTITDSDDDLNSEVTDITYVRHNRNIPTKCRNESIKPERPNIEKSPEQMEKCHNYLTRNFQNSTEKDCSSVQSFVSNTEKNKTTVKQPSGIKLTCEEDKRDNKINPALCLRTVHKLKDILQEDKLNIIIDNLMDENCPSEYIDRIIEMFDCLDYVISYKSRSENNCDSVISPVSSISKSKSQAISLQPMIVHYDNHVNAETLENRAMETKHCTQPSDMGYESIRNISNFTQLTNSKTSIQSKHNDNKDLNESASETYAGVPKISIERVLRMREASGKIAKPKLRKRKNHQTCTINPKDTTARELQFESDHTTVPATNIEQNLLDSCVSITEDEAVNTREHRNTVNQNLQERTFFSHQENNINIYENNKSTILAQKKQYEPLETQKVNLDVLIKEQKAIPQQTHKNANPKFIADVDCSSDIDVISINTNEQKPEIQKRNIIKMRISSDRYIINSNSNSDLPRKLRRSSCREFIEQPKSEIPMKRAKPTILSSVPVNLNLKINNTELKSNQYKSNINIVAENDENQFTNISSENACKKSAANILVATKPAVDTNDRKSTIDSTKQDHAKPNNRNDSDDMSSSNSRTVITNPTTRQSKTSKSVDKIDYKVLTAWMPKVICYPESKSELGLIFQGKLLNEAGHVMNRRFTTDIVLRRLSPMLIETMDHSFYQLQGCLNDNKHVLAKELVRQCRNGCPAKIEQFCLTWKMLQYDEARMVEQTSYDTSMNSLYISVSSKGRMIVPPLSYWTGERVALKDNNLIYSPGNTKQSLTPKKNSEIKKRQTANSRDTSKKVTNKETISPESNDFSSANNHQKIQSSNKPANIAISNTKMANVKKSREHMVDAKQQVAQQLTFSSPDSNTEEEASPWKHRIRSSKSNANKDTSSYSMTLRKRQKIDTSPTKISYNTINSKCDTVSCSPTKKSNYNITYTYYKKTSLPDDLLSENPESPK